MKMCGKCDAFVAGAAVMGGLICFAKKKGLCPCCQGSKMKRDCHVFQDKLKDIANDAGSGMREIKADVCRSAGDAGRDLCRAAGEVKKDFHMTASEIKDELRDLKEDMSRSR